MRLAEFQKRFSQLFRNAHSLADHDVQFWSDRTRSLGNLQPRHGLDIYRRNVFFGQCKILEDSFPRAQQHLGMKQFRATAYAFLTLHPSRSEDLLRLSESFYKYVQSLDAHEDFKAHAMIDHAWEKAFYAPLDEAMSWKELNRRSAWPLDQITLELRSSATFIRGASHILKTDGNDFPGYVIWRDDNYVRRIDGTEEKLLSMMENVQRKRPLSCVAQSLSPEELSECIAVLVTRKWLKNS